MYLNLRGPDGYTGRETDPATLANVYDDFSLVVTDLNSFGQTVVPVPFPAHGIAASVAAPALAVLVEKWGANCCSVDVASGAVVSHHVASGDRQFIGHGVFARSGETIFVSEGDFPRSAEGYARGIIGVRDPRTLELRSEMPSYGENPHECALLSDGVTLAVCNQGTVRRQPETRSNLAYIDTRSGELIEQFEVPREEHLVAHMQVTSDDRIIMVSKARDESPLSCSVYVRRPGGPLEELPVPSEYGELFPTELLSIAVDERRERVGVTCPDGNRVVFWDLQTRTIERIIVFDKPLSISLTLDARYYVVGDIYAGTWAIDAERLEPVDDVLPQEMADTHFTAPHSTIVAPTSA